MILQDSCKTGISLQEACKNTMFVRNLQDKCIFQFFPNWENLVKNGTSTLNDPELDDDRTANRPQWSQYG